MIRPCAFALFAFFLFAAPRPALAAHPALTWERIHTGAQPTRLFARLGLTHITRLGYTRDGAQKSDPDGQFPAGLTDVVPLDAEHVLLVRGTAAGRTAFRRRVAQTDTQMRLPRWHVEAFLGQEEPFPASPQNGEHEGAPASDAKPEGTVLTPFPDREGAGSAVLDIPDAPAMLIVPDTVGTRTYQLDVQDAPSGSADVLITVRPDLAASALPVAGLTLPAPPDVWGSPQTVRVHPGATALLTDKAAARAAARAKLRLPAPVSPEADVVLHVTATPFLPVTPAPIAPAPIAPAVVPPAAPPRRP